MAQFQKEELFGPSENAPDPPVRESPRTPDSGERRAALAGFVDWAAENRRLAIVAAFGIGVFLGAVARR